MSLASLQHKVNYIKDKVSPYAHQELEASFARVFSVASRLHVLPSYLQGVLFVDLCYIAVRHHIWLRHHLLSEASLAYLGDEYRLNSDCARSLISSVFERLSELSPPPTRPFFCSDDKSFLLYIFVTALTAKDNKQLIVDLGLGTPLLQRLQQAAKYLSDYQKQADKVFFGAGHDEAMIAAITELSEKKSRCPWVADCFLLLYRCADLPAPFGPWLEDEEAASLFRFLGELGLRGCVSTEEGLGWLNQHANTQALPFTWTIEQASLFFSELAKRGLVTASALPLQKQLTQKGAAARKTNDSCYYELSPLAYDITAEAYAYQHRGQRLTAAKVSALSPAWQAAYFRHLPADERPHIKALLAAKIRLHPEALELAVGKLSCNSDLNELFLDLVKIVKSGVPAIRAAVCRALGQLKTLTQADEELSHIAKTDGSALVRDTALEELRKSQHTQALTVYRQTPLASGKIA